MDDPNLLVGTETSDDAGVYQLGEDLAIINTTDYFTPIVDDPYTYGAIAATNSLSDVYSMGGIPKTALNITCWPKDQLDLGILREVLRGGADKVKQANAVSLGGHTVTSQELMYGLAVTGVVHPDRIVRNFGAKPGDVLILDQTARRRHTHDGLEVQQNQRRRSPADCGVYGAPQRIGVGGDAEARRPRLHRHNGVRSARSRI